MIGQNISHFKIIEKLGEGGMGVVYKARDTKLGRNVALKFLPESLTPTKEDYERFTREAKAAASLSHPNICTIHNIDNHEGTPFMVMEYIEGETLREKISSGGLTPEAALDYGSKIAGALTEAHEHGIIHRDIKPENIMVDAKGRIKVMDFGLAKLRQARDITKTGSTVGTLAYSSPEQIRGEEVDHRSDQFSLGIVLYEMLTGRKPFQGEHQAAMTYSIVNEEPTPIKTYLPKVPEEFTQIYKKLLSKDPGNRIESASQVTAILEKVKEAADTFSEQSSTAEIEDEATAQGGSSDSTSFTITVPDFGFGKQSMGKVGLLVSAAGILTLTIFVGWWFAESINSLEQNGSQSSDAFSLDTPSQANNRSIAVLPFTNLGGSGNAEPLSKGIHEDLLTRLSNISDLRVKSRTAVGSYSDKDLSMPAIAESLDVRWIVGGGVMEMGDQVKVNARLVDPHNDSNIWADNYLRELTAENFFAIQGDITREIAGALQAELTQGEKQRIAGAPTGNLEAYRLYVEGRSNLNTRSEEGMRNAVEYFQKAIRQDSTFALAWSGLADAIMLFREKTYATPEGPLPDAEKTATRAIKLNPRLAEAQASMGLFYMNNFNAPASNKHLQKAISLSPSYGQAHHWLGLLYLNTGKPEPALKHLRLATDLAPQHYAANGVLVQSLIANKKYEEALAKHESMKKLYPKSRELGPYLYDMIIYLHEKKYDVVINLGQKVRSTTDDPPGWSLAISAAAQLAKGDSSEYKKLYKKMNEESKNNYRTQALLGNIEAAYNEINERSLEGFSYQFIRYYFPDLLKPFRKDPRYDKLLREINQFWGLNPDGSIPNV